MRFADKEFSYYWDAIKWPVIILSAWNVAGFVASLVDFELYKNVFMQQVLGYVLPSLLLLVAGYLVAADCKGTQRQAAWGGALAGIIVGLLGIVIMVVQVNNSAYMDFVVQESLEQASAAGQELDAGTMQGLIKIGVIIGAVLGPVISGLLGALCGWIGYFVARHLC